MSMKANTSRIAINPATRIRSREKPASVAPIVWKLTSWSGNGSDP